MVDRATGKKLMGLRIYFNKVDCDSLPLPPETPSLLTRVGCGVIYWMGLRGIHPRNWRNSLPPQMIVCTVEISSPTPFAHTSQYRPHLERMRDVMLIQFIERLSANVDFETSAVVFLGGGPDGGGDHPVCLPERLGVRQKDRRATLKPPVRRRAA